LDVFAKPRLLDIAKSADVTDAYASVYKFFVHGYVNKLIDIQNRHASNALLFKILASNDNEEWHEIKAETTLSADTNTTVVNKDPWKYVDVQVKNAVAGSPATVKVIMMGSSL